MPVKDVSPCTPGMSTGIAVRQARVTEESQVYEVRPASGSVPQAATLCTLSREAAFLQELEESFL